MRIKASLKIVVLLSFLFALSAATSTTPSKVIRGCIKLDGSDAPLPQFKILFEGRHTTSDREGFFSIPLENDEFADNISLLLCADIKQHFDKHNTLKYMTVNPAKYKYFVSNMHPWDSTITFKEASLPNSKGFIPSSCVVILVDPTKNVLRTEPWSIDLGKAVVKLPVVVLKQQAASKKLDRAASKPLIRALDTTTFHHQVKVEQTLNPSAKATLSLVR